MELTRNSSMEINLTASSPDKVKTGVLVVAAFADGTLPTSTNAVSGEAKGATGRPVPLLTEFLIGRSEGRVWGTTGNREQQTPKAA